MSEIELVGVIRNKSLWKALLESEDGMYAEEHSALGILLCEPC